MDNLNVEWSSGWILSCFLGYEGKIHKPKPWINQVRKEIHTATLGMKLTSVISELEIKINISKSKVNLHPYSKSISTTKCVISPLFKINQHHHMWNRANTTNRYAPPARIWTRGFQHVNWVCRPLHHQSFTLSSYLKTTDVSFMPRVAVWISLHAWLILGFGLCIFPSHAKKQDKIQSLLQSKLRLSIHFECWEILS